MTNPTQNEIPVATVRGNPKTLNSEKSAISSITYDNPPIKQYLTAVFFQSFLITIKQYIIIVVTRLFV